MKTPYRKTKALLLANIIFWMILYFGYILKYIVAERGNIFTAIVISILVLMDIAVYALLLFGIIRNNKIAAKILIPFLLINSIMCLTDEFGIVDISALLLNVSAIILFQIEKKSD